MTRLFILCFFVTSSLLAQEEGNVQGEVQQEIAVLPEGNLTAEEISLESTAAKSPEKKTSASWTTSINGGYLLLFGRYSAGSLGISFTYELPTWGVTGELIDSFGGHYASQTILLVTPFIKKQLSDHNTLLLGVGPGISRDRFLFSEELDQKYYTVDTAFLVRDSVRIDTKYIKEVGLEIQLIQPVYRFSPTPYDSKAPTTLFRVVLEL